MSQSCTAFPFSQKNSLNTLEAMESHLEAELKDGLGLPGSVVQSSEDGLGNGLSNVTARFYSQLNPVFLYFSSPVILCGIFYKYIPLGNFSGALISHLGYTSVNQYLVQMRPLLILSW